MTWFRIDDGFHGHPKVVELSLEAVGLWALAGSWCAQYLTDGLVSFRTVRRFGASDEATAELVEAGLWTEVADGWQFKDWSDYQPMKEEVEAERSAARERMKRVRAAKKGVTSPGVRPNISGTDQERSEGSSDEVRIAPPDQLPPTSSSTSKEVENPRVDEAFERAYRVWPKKTERKKSFDKFKVAAKRHGLDFVTAKVIEFGEAYERTTEKQFVPALNVWLNGERWTDDLPEPPQPRTIQPPQSRTAQNLDAYWKEFGDDSEGGMAAIGS